MSVEYRRTVMDCCIEGTEPLSSFGILVLRHALCEDKEFARMLHWKDWSPNADVEMVRKWNEYYEEHYSKDEHLSELKMKCDILGVKLTDCVSFMKRYIRCSVYYGENDCIDELMEWLGGDEVDRDRIIKKLAPTTYG
jgi:hypothetical protein